MKKFVKTMILRLGGVTKGYKSSEIAEVAA